MSEQYEGNTALESDEGVEDTALGDAAKKDDDSGFTSNESDF